MTMGAGRHRRFVDPWCQGRWGKVRVQGKARACKPDPRRLRAGWLLPAAAVLGLAGCSGGPEPNRVTDVPISWWRSLQGGRIAELRPPPPGVGEPYPNLATVPARPTPTDPAARRAIAARLAAERDDTRRENANDPLPEPSAANRPVATSAAPRQSSAAGTDPDDVTTIVVEAANAPPPRPAPGPDRRMSGRSGNATVQPTASADGEPAPIPAPAEASGPLPELPTGAPPRPPFEPPPLASPPRAQGGLSVQFAPGSADLPAEGQGPLRTLAARRGASVLLVTGGGDAVGSPEALALGLRRAQAIAAVLRAAGVPETSIRIEAQATGRGGSARLLNPLSRNP